jgi:hypothetical protein
LGVGASVASAQDFRSSLALAPYLVSFGEVSVGKASDPQTITLLTTGGSGEQIDKITVAGDFSQTNDCPVAPALLAQNQTCGIQVTFKPAAPGPASGTVSLFHDGRADPITVSLKGTGTLNTSSVRISPSSLNFGEQSIGTPSAPQTLTLSDSGKKTLLFSAIDGDGDFTIMPSSTCKTFGGSLEPGASCTVVVTFTPLGTGKRSGKIAFTDDAGDSPQSVPLTGMGKEQ